MATASHVFAVSAPDVTPKSFRATSRVAGGLFTPMRRYRSCFESGVFVSSNRPLSVDSLTHGACDFVNEIADCALTPKAAYEPGGRKFESCRARQLRFMIKCEGGLPSNFEQPVSFGWAGQSLTLANERVSYGWQATRRFRRSFSEGGPRSIGLLTHPQPNPSSRVCEQL
jgi:hypothetical protein